MSVLKKRSEVKHTEHNGFSSEDAKELEILNRTIKIDEQNGEMTWEAAKERVAGALKRTELVGAKGVDSPRVR